MLRKSNKLFCLFIAAAFAFSALLSGCGTQKQPAAEENPSTAATTAAQSETKAESKEVKKVSLRFAYNWSGGDTKAPFFEGMLNKFAESNKDRLDLVLEATPGMDHETKIKVDAAADNLPDVFTFWLTPSLYPLIDGNMIIPVEEYLKESKTIKKEQFSDGAWAVSTRNGKAYSIPLESWVGFMLANKKLFDKYQVKIPTTFEEMKTAAEIFNKNGIILLSMTSKSGDPAHLPWSSFVYQFDKGYEQAQEMAGNWIFKTDNVLKAGKIVEDFRAYKMIPEDTIANGGDDGAVALFNEEKAAMVYTFPWMIAAVKPEVVDISECIAVPMFDGSVVDPASFTVGGIAMGAVIGRKAFDNPDKKALLVDFIDTLASDEMFAELAKAGNFSPKNTVKIDKASVLPLFAKVSEFTAKQNILMAHENFFPDSNATQTFKSTMDELFAGAVNGGQFADKVQKALDKAKK